MYCDGTASLGFFAALISFGLGYFIARHNIWSHKTNQLIKISEVRTSEGKKKI